MFVIFGDPRQPNSKWLTLRENLVQLVGKPLPYSKTIPWKGMNDEHKGKRVQAVGYRPFHNNQFPTTATTVPLEEIVKPKANTLTTTIGEAETIRLLNIEEYNILGNYLKANKFIFNKKKNQLKTIHA